MAHPRTDDIGLSPVGCLALLWPSLTDALASPARRARAEDAAGRFAPIARIAVELRLGAGDAALDLHQLVTRHGDEPGLLLRHLDAGIGDEMAQHPIWRFLRDWAADVRQQEAIDRLFLEWDDPSGDDGPPAIFLPVDMRRGDPDARAPRRKLARDLLERLQPGSVSARAVDRLCDGIGGGISISHIGVMSGRAAGVRVNVRAVPRGTLGTLLANIGWQGDIAAAGEHFDRLVDCADRVTVAFDLGPELLPSIGFEAFLDGAPASEPRWAVLLDHLEANGLCAADKREVLLAIHSDLFPETPDQPWPAQWIVATASAPQDRLPWFERRMSHVKLVLAMDGSASAKAYVSGQHHWMRGPDERAIPSFRSEDSSAKAATEFLLAARGQDSLWRDFRLVNGVGDEWISAFVGCALAPLNDPAVRTALEQTLAALLERQRPLGGWGYNQFSPPDADSTAWVLKFLRAVRYCGPEVEAAEAFLRRHILRDGGFATYAVDTPIRFGQCLESVPATGWRGDHPCVMANAAAVLSEELVGPLRARRSANGAWPAYWWRNDIYATGLALEALDVPGRTSEAAGAHALTLAWARDRVHDGRSAFDRAWLVQILTRGDREDQGIAQSLCTSLIADQNEDGGWAAGAEMLFPPPLQPERDCEAPYILDHNRIFTTASVLIALTGQPRNGRDNG